MRFLHTSDWHLGKTLKGRSRSDEHDAALAEILDIAKRETVDCVLITGDIFDSQAPPPEAERLAFNFFSELRGSSTPACHRGITITRRDCCNDANFLLLDITFDRASGRQRRSRTNSKNGIWLR